MDACATPMDEARRLAVVQALKLLDTPREERFDRMVRLACKVCDVPIAAFTVADSERMWFKSTLGLGAATETVRRESFCEYAAYERGVFYVPDTLQDVRFLHNPLVAGAPHVRFYAAAPLFVDGAALGTLCVLDTRPRVFDEATLRHLRDLGDCLQDDLRTRLIERKAA
ncbi:GAF domain-containing protein [Lysobacter xanthus]